MGERKNRSWQWVLLVLLGTFFVGCNSYRNSPSTPEAAMALLPQADVVKRITFHKLWRLDKSQIDSNEDLSDVSKPLTPDGKLFVTSIGLPRHGQMRLRSMETGQPVRTWTMGEGLKHIWFTPDGTKMVAFLQSTRPGGELLLYDANVGKQVLKFETPVNHEPLSFAFDPSGQRFVSGGLFGDCIVFSLTEPKPVRTFKVGTGWVRSVRFSPDGEMLVVYVEAAYGDGSTTHWRISDAKQVPTLSEVEDRGPVLPQNDSFDLRFPITLQGAKGLLYQFTLSTPSQYATGVCTFDPAGKLTAWGVLPDHARLDGVSPDGRLALSRDTRDPQYGLPEVHSGLTAERLNANGIREIIPPIRGWAIDLPDR